MEHRVEVDQKQLARVVSALRAEGDGKQLSRDLVRELRHVAEPAAAAARAEILSMGSHSDTIPGLRTTVASHVKVKVRLTGKHPGVMVRVGKTGMPRGFRNAPKRLNSARGWRHKVFGNPDVWVVQRGKPGWFDDTMHKFTAETRKGAAAALDKVAKRIDNKTRG
jgi:hypothetical protein